MHQASGLAVRHVSRTRLAAILQEFSQVEISCLFMMLSHNSDKLQPVLAVSSGEREKFLFDARCQRVDSARVAEDGLRGRLRLQFDEPGVGGDGTALNRLAISAKNLATTPPSTQPATTSLTKW